MFSKSICFGLLLVSPIAFIKGQQLISFAGGMHGGNGYVVCSSLGEIAIETLSESNNSVTQGYQQPFITVSTEEVQLFNAIIRSRSGNNASKNAYFHITGINNHPNNELTIVNRWGEIVWKQQGYDNELVRWEGEGFNEKPLPQATYYYLLTIKNLNRTFKGSVDILYIP